jgi:endonuclease YncB( thermonuclease family)
LCAIALAAAGRAAADFTGRVVTVHDGDTISVLVGRTPVRVRLVGIDAPERMQPYGAASRRALADRVAGRDVHVVERGRDVFGRVLGRVFVQGADVNAEQVRSGYAWVYRFERDATLLALEAEARAARRGLWGDVRAVPPWQWRERQPKAVPAERASSPMPETAT